MEECNRQIDIVPTLTGKLDIIFGMQNLGKLRKIYKALTIFVLFMNLANNFKGKALATGIKSH